MIAQLVSLAILGVVGGLAGFHYAKLERDKKSNKGQLPLPYRNEDREAQRPAVAR